MVIPRDAADCCALSRSIFRQKQSLVRLRRFGYAQVFPRVGFKWFVNIEKRFKRHRYDLARAYDNDNKISFPLISVIRQMQIKISCVTSTWV